MMHKFSTCEGNNCPSKDNCRRHKERNSADSVPAALWVRREPGDSACDMVIFIEPVSTFKE